MGAAVILAGSLLGVGPADARTGTVRDVPGMKGLLDVWCRADGSCLGVGYTPDNVGAVIVLRAALPSGPVRVVPGTTGLSAITCRKGGSCVAVGESGQGGVVVDVGLDGTPAAPRDVPGSFRLHDVACPTPTTCLATGSVLNRQQPLHFYPTSLPVFTVITDGQPAPAQRFPRGIRSMNGIACPTTTTCLATSNEGIAVLTDTNGAWSAILRPAGGSFATGFPTDAISCPSSTTCHVTAAGFIPTAEGYIGVPAMMTVGLTGVVGPVQLLSNESGFAGSISCAYVRTCTLVGQDNLAGQGIIINVFRGSPAGVTRWAGANSFGTVSCVEAATCGIGGHTVATAVFAWQGTAPG